MRWVVEEKVDTNAIRATPFNRVIISPVKKKITFFKTAISLKILFFSVCVVPYFQNLRVKQSSVDITWLLQNIPCQGPPLAPFCLFSFLCLSLRNCGREGERQMPGVGVSYLGKCVLIDLLCVISIQPCSDPLF